jgi:hypothetical protein
VIGHLLTDLVRRTRGMWAWLVVCLAGACLWIVVSPTLSDRDMVAFSIGSVLLLGWFFPQAALNLREVLLRPISRRDLWLARCAVAAATCLLPPLVLALTLPFRAGGPADWITVALTVLGMNLLCVGSLAGAASLLPPDFWAAGTVGPVKVALATAYFMSPFLPAAMPALWHVRAGDFTVATWGFVVMAIGLTIVAARHVPQPGFMVPRRAVRSSGSGWAGQRLDQSSRLRALPFMFADEAKFALLFGASMMTMVSLFTRLIDGQWFLPASSAMLAPFTGAPIDEQPTGGFIWVLFGPPGLELSRYSLRQLRALPVSSLALAATLITTRWLHIFAAWLVLLVLASLATGTWPTHWRPELLSMALGCAALGATGSLAVGVSGWRGQIPVMVAAMATAATLRAFAEPPSFSATVILWSMGPGLGVVAVVISRMLLRRRSTLYRRPTPNWNGGLPQS